MTRVLATALLSLALVGCGEERGEYFGSTSRRGKDPATFYVNNSSEPEYLDPGRCTDGGCGALVQQLFEGLTNYHPKDAHPVQGVATRWEQSSDNRLFRFHLREDARWSDGKPVTAGDFAYAWRRVLRPATASRAAANLYVLKNAELFNHGQLRVLRETRALKAESGEIAQLPKGQALRVLEPAVGGLVKVEVFTDLPTYGARRAAEPGPRGLVPESALGDDDSMVGVRAVGDHVLEVELEQPTPYFTELTSHHTLMPVRRDVVEAFERRGEGEKWVRPGNMVSNGPYALEGWRFQYEITMNRNPFYWNRDALKIHRIVWLEVEDYHATMNLYKAAEIDYIGDNLAPPPEYNPVLAKKRDYLRNDFLSVYWYELNTRKPPLDDVRVRRALDLGIDKQQLVDKITRSGQRPATHFVPDITGAGYAEAAAADREAGRDPFHGPGVDFDPERARALLKEAGYEVIAEGGGYRAERFPALEVLYNTSDAHRQIAVAIQAMWKQNLGISAGLRNEEWKVMLKNYRDGNFQIMRFGQTADYNHAHTFLEPFLAQNPQNQTGWADEAFDRALHEAAATADPKESIRRYREAEKLAVAGMARIPLYFYTRSCVVKPWVKGFWGSARNAHAIQYLWLDPEGWRQSPNVPAFPPPEFPAPGPWEKAP